MNDDEQRPAAPAIDMSTIGAMCQDCPDALASVIYRGRLLCHRCASIAIDAVSAELDRIAEQIHHQGGTS